MYVPINPNLETVAVRPTKNNPDILVDIGSLNGELAPKGIVYPDHMGVEDVMSKARRYMAYGSSQSCPVCQRYKTEQAVKMSLVLSGVVIGIIICSYIGYKMTRAKECSK